MTRLVTISAICLLIILTGCSRVVFESETGPAPELLQLTRPGGSIISIVGTEARQPDVAFDRARVAFIRPVAGIGQVFVMEIGDPATLQQLTSDSAPKTLPRWSSAGRLAFRSGSGIVVLNADFSPFDLGLPPLVADGGLDFYDNGNALVYLRDNNLHTVPLDRSVPEMQITGCPPAAGTLCRFPVVSHDQTKLAYLISYVFGAGRLEMIYVVQTGTWAGLSSIPMGAALSISRVIHSYDFSRTDDSMYVASRPFDETTMTYGPDSVLFEVNLDGSDKQQLPPAPTVRYPSAR